MDGLGIQRDPPKIRVDLRWLKKQIRYSQIIIWDHLRLEEEFQKESARQQLHEAMRSQDTARLRDALTAAERHLSDSELHAARELLQRLERQARARENLKKAMEAMEEFVAPSDAAKLRQALEEAEAAGLGSDDLAAATADVGCRDTQGSC